MTNERAKLVTKAQRAFAQCPDTRALKREAKNGNPYVLAKLASRGLVYAQGTIRRSA